MRKISLIIVCLSLASVNVLFAHKAGAVKTGIAADTVKTAIMNAVNTVIKASGTFEIDKVADLYTPNAVIADEEPPFSWNGATAGIQWVSTVEKTVKDAKLTGFKAQTLPVSVFLKSGESVYVVVPVNYTGEVKGEPFEEDGAFTFIFRIVNGKWLIKSQVWTAKKGM